VIYQKLGSAYGRDVYLFTYDDDLTNTAGEIGDAPPNYSVAAVVLRPEWPCDELAWTLNALYGALDEWDEFKQDSGARSFAFYGERADVASNLCDTLAYAWTRGANDEYDSVIASAHDETSLEDFVESLFSGEILAGDEYIEKLTSIVFAVQTDEQAQQVGPIINAAIDRHKAD
jgi:hypothetical protein